MRLVVIFAICLATAVAVLAEPQQIYRYPRANTPGVHPGGGKRLTRIVKVRRTTSPTPATTPSSKPAGSSATSASASSLEFLTDEEILRETPKRKLHHLKSDLGSLENSEEDYEDENRFYVGREHYYDNRIDVKKENDGLRIAEEADPAVVAELDHDEVGNGEEEEEIEYEYYYDDEELEEDDEDLDLEQEDHSTENRRSDEDTDGLQDLNYFGHVQRQREQRLRERERRRQLWLRQKRRQATKAAQRHRYYAQMTQWRRQWRRPKYVVTSFRQHRGSKGGGASAQYIRPAASVEVESRPLKAPPPVKQPRETASARREGGGASGESTSLMRSMLGVKPFCIHDDAQFSCTFTPLCWMQGGVASSGCDSMLYSCCVSHTIARRQVKSDYISIRGCKLITYANILLQRKHSV